MLQTQASPLHQDQVHEAGVVLLILIVTSITTFSDVFGGTGGGILTIPVLGLGYFLGKKYLFNKRSR